MSASNPNSDVFDHDAGCTQPSSEAEVDIVKSDQLQTTCYLSKPVQLDAFESLVNSINDFWLTKVKLPQQRQSG